MMASINTAVTAMYHGRIVMPPSIVPSIPPHHRIRLLYSLIECSMCFTQLAGDHTTWEYIEASKLVYHEVGMILLTPA